MSEDTQECADQAGPGNTEEVNPEPGVKWLLILVGETGIQEHEIPSEEFKTPERIFWKAEDVADKKEGHVNDVYYLYHKNEERHVCLYFKHKV
jgi:hypothetical protein